MKVYLFGLVALACATATGAQDTRLPADLSERIEPARPQRGRDVIAVDPRWSASLAAYARQNGLVMLASPSDREIAGLPAAMAYGGPEFDGECTAYRIGFVTDSARSRVWPVLFDADGRKVVLLMGREGDIYLAGPAGVEPMARPHHRRGQTRRMHRRECRNQPH